MSDELKQIPEAVPAHGLAEATGSAWTHFLAELNGGKTPCRILSRVNSIVLVECQTRGMEKNRLLWMYDEFVLPNAKAQPAAQNP